MALFDKFMYPDQASLLLAAKIFLIRSRDFEGKSVPRNRKTEPILDANGEVIREIYPYPRAFRDDLSWLETHGHGIFRRLFEKYDKYDKYEPPYMRPASVLRRSSYIIGAQIIHRELYDQVDRFLEKDSKTKSVKTSGPTTQDNPFFAVLHIIQQNDVRHSGGPPIFLARDQKTKSANILMYAFLSKVPAQHLTGFLLQIGHNEVLKRAKESREVILREASQQFEQNECWDGIIKAAETYRNRRKR